MVWFYGLTDHDGNPHNAPANRVRRDAAGPSHHRGLQRVASDVSLSLVGMAAVASGT